MKFGYTLLKKLAPAIKSKEQLVEALTFHAFEVDGIDGDTIDISIPANRYSDAASHGGIATIASAVLGKRAQDLKLLKLKSKAQSPKFKVAIAAKEPCPRYSGLYAEVAKVQPSPKWLQDILISCGLRPINNIVDVMNYVMLEMGQPLHAFDYDKIANSRTIYVRLAKSNEKVTTLDGDEYKLSAQDLVIADDKQALAIAGIKGGKAAEVTQKTRRIIVEAANFDPVSVYKSSRRLNLFTDASARFAHGLSSALVEQAIKRAARLLKEICGAKIGDWVDVNYAKPQRVILKFDVNRFNNLTGLNLSAKICLEYLKRLRFNIRSMLVEAPPERTDIAIFEDLAEEIVNLYGYEKLPSIAPRVAIHPSGYEDQIRLKDNIRRVLTGFGLSEVYNYSFLGDEDFKAAGQRVSGLVELENPISEDKKYLRPSLVSLLAKNLEDNLRFYDEVRVFEIGKIFRKEKDAVSETLSLGIALASKKGAPFLELKGLADGLLKGLGLVDFEMIPYLDGLRVESDHHVIGFLHPSKEIKQGVVAEFDLDKAARLVVEEKEYRPLPKYPSVMRDLSIIVSDDARVGEVQDLIENASRLLDDADLLDWYEDPKLGPNRKSLTFRLVFQAEDRTLTDKEVGKEMEKVVTALRARFDIELR